MNNNEQISQNINIKDLLGAMNKINDSFSYGIYIPSLGRDVQFRQMSTAQQKAFVKTAMNTNQLNSEFLYSIFSTIKANCAEPDIDVSKFTILDKMFICMKIRSMSISPIVKITIDGIVDEAKNLIQFSINLDELYAKMKTQYTMEFSKEITSDDTPYVIRCEIPNIGDEIKLEQELQEGIKKSLENNRDDQTVISNAIGEIFIQDLSKYITSIDVPVSETQIRTVDMSTLNFKDRIRILEALPNQISAKLVEHVNEITKHLNSLTIANFKHGGKDYKYQLQVVSSDFFIDS